MQFQKRDRWTEADIDALPTGEHDYFERKSGRGFAQDQSAFLDTVAKAASAFLNSGGGSLILGVRDDGTPDGLPTTVGRTSMRDWIEQKIPNLLEYPASDFRVHRVEPTLTSRIPNGTDVVVIDFGDSALAPHQRKNDKVYFYRAAGRSERAPHFYLELLRQRYTEVKLDARLASASPAGAHEDQAGVLIKLKLRFEVSNVGRVAAYKWALQIRQVHNHSSDQQAGDFSVGRVGSGIRVDDTLLPGCQLDEEREFGVRLRPSLKSRTDLESAIGSALMPLEIGFIIATETSPGEPKCVALKDYINQADVIAAIQRDCPGCGG